MKKAVRPSMIVEGLEPLKAAVFTHAPAAAGMLLPVALRLADALRVPRIRSFSVMQAFLQQ